MSKQKKSILYIWDADYPWDVRVEKICKALLKNGYEAHIAARNLKRFPCYEKMEGLHIHRLKAFGNDRLNYVISFPAFFSPVWKRFLDTIIKQNAIDLIIVRDLPMAIAGIRAGKRNNIPVIFDMAEDYVAMLKNIWKYGRFNGLNLIVRNPYLARFVERYAFKKADRILVVVEEAEDVVLKRGGNDETITVVSNTPPKESFSNFVPVTNDVLKRIRQRFSVIYTGGIQRGRGIQLVFEAVPEIVREIPDFLFVVVGDGYATEELKQLMLQKHIDCVEWVGWIAHDKIFDYISASRIGLIPHFVTDHVNTTIPNKIFDYMGLGLPVVASDAIPMKRIIEETGCGKTFRSGDPMDLARTIVDVYKSDINFGGKGKEAVASKYNWEEDEKRLLEVAERCLLGKPPVAGKGQGNLCE